MPAPKRQQTTEQRLRSDLDTARDTITRQAIHLHSLRREVEQTQEALDAMRVDRAEVEAAEALRSELAAVRAELTATTAAAEMLQGQHDTLTRTHAAEISTLAARVKALQDDLDGALTRMEAIWELYQATDAARDDVTARAQQAEAELAAARADLDLGGARQLRSRLRARRDDLDRVRAQRAAAVGEVAILREHLASRDAEIAYLRRGAARGQS